VGADFSATRAALGECADRGYRLHEGALSAETWSATIAIAMRLQGARVNGARFVVGGFRGGWLLGGGGGGVLVGWGLGWVGGLHGSERAALGVRG